MGILDFFKNRKSRKQNLQYARMLNGDYPIFTQYGQNIYSSDVVQQALYTIVTEMKKLKPRHIRRDGFDMVPVYDDVQRVLDNPNELMTRSDFIEKVAWQVLLNYNSFIYIQRDSTSGRLAGLYPLAPAQVTFLDGSGRLYCQMLFSNGEEYTLPYDSLIHIRTHYSINDIMGGNEQGQPDNDALLQTLDLNNVLLQGVKKALKSSFAINGIVKYNTMLDDGKIAEQIGNFETKLANSQSGILGIDNKADVIQFKRDLQTVDDATLRFIDDKILRQFGTPLEIVRGSYTTAQYQAFYQKTLEPLIINFSEAFTKRLFTDRELGYSNEIMFMPKELVFMSTQQTLEMVRLLGDKGIIYDNEARVAFGLAPLEELRGRRTMSLNYVDASIANQYQLQDNSSDENDSEGGADAQDGDTAI